MMQTGQVNKADAVAVKIGAAIIRFNSTEMAQTDITMDSKSMWAKVRSLLDASVWTKAKANHMLLQQKY